MWFNDEEEYGYVYKCVVPLGSSTSASVIVGGKNSIWDDNNGKRFTVKKGINFIVTEGVAEPFSFTMKRTFKDGSDLGTADRIGISPNGGYTPYKYKLIVRDRQTGEDENNKDYNTIYFRNADNQIDYVPYTEIAYTYQKVTDYDVTLIMEDAAGTVASKTFQVVLS